MENFQQPQQKEDNTPLSTPIPSKFSSFQKLVILSGVALLLIIVGAGGFLLGKSSTDKEPLAQDPTITPSQTTKHTPVTVACSADAKLCPDGSSVGRTGPNCEFAQCEEKDESSWNQYSDNTFLLHYPSSWIITSSGQDENDYLGRFVQLASLSGKTTLQISEKRAVYGFEGNPDMKTKQQKLSFSVGNQEIEGQEYITIKNDTETGAYIDTTISINGKEYWILFGTGYPATSDDFTSYEDYLLNKQIIFDILKTLVVNVD